MSNPISLRIAAKTRNFETCGESSYYYSSQLIDNLALLLAVDKLGQQLGWPSKQKTKNMEKDTTFGSVLLSKAGKSKALINTGKGDASSPVIDLKSTPGKQWALANTKLVQKLGSSQIFFSSKALSTGLGSAFDCWNLGGFFISNQNLLETTLFHHKKNGSSRENRPRWVLGKQKKAEKIRNPIVVRTPGPIKPTIIESDSQLSDSFAKVFPQSKASFEEDKLSFTSFDYVAQLAKFGRKTTLTLHQDSKTINRIHVDNKSELINLPFYLTCLRLIGHPQVLRSSLALAPIIISSNNSNLIRDTFGIIKSSSPWSGLGLTSNRPKCYISRSHKETALNIFLKMPDLQLEKRENSVSYSQVYLSAETFGTRSYSHKKQKPSGPLNKLANYVSVRWL